MKTEDIDKKIGMPDVNDEWAKFESEVINKEAGKVVAHYIYGWVVSALPHRCSCCLC